MVVPGVVATILLFRGLVFYLGGAKVVQAGELLETSGLNCTFDR
jgi:hypothetical protein